MSRISLVRTNQPIPNESELGAVRSFLFGVVDGAGKDDRSRWQKFWSKVERIDERGWVFVTDWLDFDTEAPRDPLPGGYVPPRERTFAFDADEFSRRSLRYWKRVTPNAEAHRGA